MAPFAGPLTVGDIDTMVRTLYGEVRGEPLIGQIGVAWVIRTRAEWPGKDWWGDTITDVCKAKWQFSCWFDAQRPRLLTLRGDDVAYTRMLTVAQNVLAGFYDDPTGGATHYLRFDTDAPWEAGRTPTVRLGAHDFYRVGPHG